MTHARTRLASIAAVFGLLLLACGGGTGLVDEAEAMAETQCQCTTFDCTLAQTEWFNRTGFAEEDQINSLSEADRARYDAARSKSADCQNALRE